MRSVDRGILPLIFLMVLRGDRLRGETIAWRRLVLAALAGRLLWRALTCRAHPDRGLSIQIEQDWQLAAIAQDLTSSRNGHMLQGAQG